MTAFLNSASGLVGTFGASMVAKATLILLLTLLLLRVARHTRASLRHLLAAAAFTMLLLLPVAAVLGPAVRVTVTPVPPALEEYLAESLFLVNRTPDAFTSATGSSGMSPPHWTATPVQLLTATWLGGVLLCAIPLLVGLRQIRWLRRTALPWRDGQRLVDSLGRAAGARGRIDVLLHEAVAAPATCGFLRHAIVFPVDARRWSEQDVVRAAVHEVEHVRRADCVVNIVARVGCALYWFHPLVWIVSRRLGLEAERACDDAVLRQAEATAYADQLVALAGRMAARPGFPLLAMANRSDLVQRVAAVLDERQARGRVTVAGAAGIAAFAGAFIVAVAPLQGWSGAAGLASRQSGGRTAVPTLLSGDASGLGPLNQAAVQAPAPPPAAVAAAAPPDGPADPNMKFEVLSVRPNVSGFATPGAATVGLQPGGRFSAVNATVRQLLNMAYSSGGGIEDARLIGAPGWLNTERFDIEARAPESTNDPRVFRALLRSLLADRFGLLLRTEVREMPVYALIVGSADGRLGRRLRRSIDCTLDDTRVGPGRTSDPSAMCGSEGAAGRYLFGGIPLSFLVGRLSGELGRVVVDRTGLSGFFDGSLEWTPDPVSSPAAETDPVSPPTDAPSLVVALQEQFGLKVEPSTAPIEVFVIERVERPTSN